MNNLFSYAFWFKTAVLTSWFIRSFWVFVGFLVVLGIFSRIMINLRKKDIPLIRFFKKLSALSFAMAFLGLLVLFCNLERLPLLSNRFLFLLWVIGFLIWLIIVLKYLFINLPRLKKELSAKEQFKKYLPK